MDNATSTRVRFAAKYDHHSMWTLRNIQEKLETAKTNVFCLPPHTQTKTASPHSHILLLTLFLPIATLVPYANSLDPDEMPSNSTFHPDPSCLTLRLYFH